jgi:hypothetical protein
VNCPMEQVEAAVADGLTLMRRNTGSLVAFVVIAVVPGEGGFKTLVASNMPADFQNEVIRTLAGREPDSTETFERDPELSAEERENLLHGPRRKRAQKAEPVEPAEAAEARDWFKWMHAIVDQAQGGGK